MSLYDIANQAASAGGHMAMEIGTTTSAPQACTGPPAGAPPPPGATQISQRGVYPSAYPVAYPTAYPDEIPLAEASVVWQSFSPDGFGEIAPGYALAPAPPKGRKRKQSAGRRDAHGNQLVYASYSPLSIEEAWRDHHQRVTSARQQAEAEGLVLQRSAQSASGYKGVAINKLPHGEKDRPRPYQGYVVRAEKKMHLGSFSVPEEAALAVARELAAEAAWAAQYPSAAMTVARSTPAPPPAPQSAPTPLPPPLAPGTKVAIRGLTGRREMNGRTGVILHWLEDFERWVVAIDGDDDETDTEIKRPPLVTVGSQFATPLDALPLVFSTTIADGEAPPGTAEAAGSGSDVDIATVEGVAIATVESEREESRRMRVKPRNLAQLDKDGKWITNGWTGNKTPSGRRLSSKTPRAAQPQPAAVGVAAATAAGAPPPFDDVGARDGTAARNAAGLVARAVVERAAAGPRSERKTTLPAGWDMVLRGSPGKYYKRYVGPGQQRAMSVKIAWQVHVQHEEAKVRREMRLAAAREDQRLALANGGVAGGEPQQASSTMAKLLPPMAVEVDVLEAEADVGEQGARTERTHGGEQVILLPVAVENNAGGRSNLSSNLSLSAEVIDVDAHMPAVKKKRTHAGGKLLRWTPDECAELMGLVEERGGWKEGWRAREWQAVADGLGTGRSAAGVNQHWHVLSGRRKPKAKDAS